jgi:branched-chain amino acid transport system substrate-binding protein
MKRSTVNNVLKLTLISSLGLGAIPAISQANPIKIGFVTELTGAWTFFGTSCVAGLKMATDEINKAGGVLKRPLEFVIQDNQTLSLIHI